MKKTYAQPTLTAYGNVEQLTQAFGAPGDGDSFESSQLPNGFVVTGPNSIDGSGDLSQLGNQ